MGPSEHYCIEGFKGGALIGSPIMPRDASLSDSGYNFFQLFQYNLHKIPKCNLILKYQTFLTYLEMARNKRFEFVIHQINILAFDSKKMRKGFRYNF